jgi:phosphate-selective porin
MTRIAITIAILTTSLALGACGSAPQSDPATTDVATATSTPPKPHTATKPHNATVTGCLKRDQPEEAKLTGVQNRGGGVWIGYTADGDLIRVKNLGNAHDAKAAVKAATEVTGASGKGFFVVGPLGSDLAVKPIARCLRSVS